MKVSFLESGQILASIKRLLESKDIYEIDIAVAYLSKGGYSEVEKAIKNFLRRKGRIKFLVGLSHVYATESRALKALLALAKKQKNNQFEVKYHRFKKREFHPKLILAKSKSDARIVIVGSSNFTSGGQKKNVEANIMTEIDSLQNLDEKNFLSNVESFFRYVWDSGKFLDSEIIKNYATGEEEARRVFSSKIRKSVPPTDLLRFVYLNGERRTVKSSFEVLCTDCSKNYIEIPMNALYCRDCGIEPLVETPTPNKEELTKKRQLQGVTIKIDGKKIVAKEVDISCPDCNIKVGMANDFMLWVICDECARKRKMEGAVVCKPFTKWDNEKAKNLSYGIGKSRLIVNE